MKGSFYVILRLVVTFSCSARSTQPPAPHKPAPPALHPLLGEAAGKPSPIAMSRANPPQKTQVCPSATSGGRGRAGVTVLCSGLGSHQPCARGTLRGGTTLSSFGSGSGHSESRHLRVVSHRDVHQGLILSIDVLPHSYMVLCQEMVLFPASHHPTAYSPSKGHAQLATAPK